MPGGTVVVIFIFTGSVFAGSILGDSEQAVIIKPSASMATMAAFRKEIILRLLPPVRTRLNQSAICWYKAGEALARADRSWLARLVTRREGPEDFAKALERRAEDIRVVIQFASF